MADGSFTGWITSQANVLANIAQSLAPVERLLTGAMYLLGLSFAFKAIYALKAFGEQRTMYSSHADLKGPIIWLLVSGIFLYFPTAFSIFLNSTFGYSSPLAYALISSGNETLDSLFGPNSSVGRPLALIIQVVGIIAFIRGWMLIARSASSGGQPGGTGKGMMHVFGGILAMNIVGTINIINNTLYGAGS